MKSIEKCLKSLDAASYLRAQSNSKCGGGLLVELLPHGKNYCAQLLSQWRRARSNDIYLEKFTPEDAMLDQRRLNFVAGQQFKSHFQTLRKHNEAKYPAVIRFQSKLKKSLSLGLFQYTKGTTLLISDFFVSSRRGLESFYSVQRESKIWWMRYATNPSRYYIEPYDLQEETSHESNGYFAKNCQSTDIKVRFPEGIATVEHLTLVPLKDINLGNNVIDYQLKNDHNNEMMLPTVIRSVIQMETAACAMLLDSCVHGRDGTLLLNRKLAPYQCAIVAYGQDVGKNSTLDSDLADLSAHFTHILRRAGLRVHTSKTSTADVRTEQGFQMYLETIDRLGIPYALLINYESLQSGLCHLRCRDTTLTETIHISDLPIYLQNIFTN